MKLQNKNHVQFTQLPNSRFRRTSTRKKPNQKNWRWNDWNDHSC